MKESHEVANLRVGACSTLSDLEKDYRKNDLNYKVRGILLVSEWVHSKVNYILADIDCQLES